MKNQLVIVLLLTIASQIFSQDEITPWEKLGISQTEWMMIQEHHLPMSKVGELLQNGIGIREYFNQPWVELRLSESRWIAKRRSGLTNEEIANGISRPKRDDSWKTGNKEIVKSDFTAVSGQGQRLSALFLPGYQQFKGNRKLTGTIMVGISIGSLVWSGAGSIPKKQFYSLPVFTLFVPTMIWSLIDYSVHSKNHVQTGN
jgi:hypothetical protein